MKKIICITLLIWTIIIPTQLFAGNHDNCDLFTKEGYVCYLSNDTGYTTFKLCDNIGTIISNDNDGELFFIHDSQKDSMNFNNLLIQSYKKGYKISIECHKCRHGYCKHYHKDENNFRLIHGQQNHKKNYNLTHALNCIIKFDTNPQTEKYGIIIKQPTLLSMETVSIGTSFLQLADYPIEFIDFTDISSSDGMVDWKYFIRPYEKTKLATILISISLNKKLILWIDPGTGHISSISIK